jgi:hypothetical protein
MAFLIRDQLSFCMVDAAPVFLDIAADRYFSLKGEKQETFRKCLAGIGPDDGDPAVAALAGSLGVEPVRLRHLSSEYALRAERPETNLKKFEPGRAPAWRLPEAVARKWYGDRTVRRVPLARIVQRFRARKRPSTEIGAREREIISLHQAARLLRSGRNRCLADSIALADWLAGRFCFPDLVLGVSTAPFQAHCWLQLGRMVLNDTPDRVASYQPILIL